MATAPMTGERFDIGRVAALTFGVIGRNPVLFVGVALIFSGLPALAISALDAEAEMADSAIGGLILFGLTYFVLGSLMQTSLVVATLQDLSGQRVDFAACLKRALVMFFPLIALSLLLGLAVGAASLFLLVPGIVLYVMWFVAAPALVEERRGVFAAFGRSRELTRGARWPIFGLVVAFLIFSLVVGLGTTMLDRLTDRLGATDIGAAELVNALASMLTSLVASTGVAATYVELRTVKEGANVDALAAVFA